MGNEESSTIFPRWAIGLIVGGVLLLVALAIIIGRYVIEKKNKGNVANTTQVSLNPSGPNQRATTVAIKKPLFERIRILWYKFDDEWCARYMKEFLKRMKAGYTAHGLGNTYTINNFPSLLKFSFTKANIGVASAADPNEPDLLITDDILHKIAVELNDLKYVITANETCFDKDMAGDIKNCIDRINGLEPISYKYTQS